MFSKVLLKPADISFFGVLGALKAWTVDGLSNVFLATVFAMTSFSFFDFVSVAFITTEHWQDSRDNCCMLVSDLKSGRRSEQILRPVSV